MRQVYLILFVYFVLGFAQAYNYHGETLLAQDKCGDAIKCLEESQSRNLSPVHFFRYLIRF